MLILIWQLPKMQTLPLQFWLEDPNDITFAPIGRAVAEFDFGFRIDLFFLLSGARLQCDQMIFFKTPFLNDNGPSKDWSPGNQLSTGTLPFVVRHFFVLDICDHKKVFILFFPIITLDTLGHLLGSPTVFFRHRQALPMVN